MVTVLSNSKQCDTSIRITCSDVGGLKDVDRSILIEYIYKIQLACTDFISLLQNNRKALKDGHTHVLMGTLGLYFSNTSEKHAKATEVLTTAISLSLRHVIIDTSPTWGKDALGQRKSWAQTTSNVSSSRRPDKLVWPHCTVSDDSFLFLWLLKNLIDLDRLRWKSSKFPHSLLHLLIHFSSKIYYRHYICNG